RARNLLAAAREVVERYNGALPATQSELSELKGFGPYTSGAVASIAFGEVVPAVDGNVRRVLSRILATPDPLDDVARDLVDPNDPSSFNQSVMELGARICIPRNPKCSDCPVQSLCKAYELDQVNKFPPSRAATKIQNVFATSWVITREKSVFIRK